MRNPEAGHNPAIKTLLLPLLLSLGGPAQAQVPPPAPAGTPAPAAPPRDLAAASLAPLADQLAKSPDAVVAEVNGTPVTIGMVADRLRDMPKEMAALPTSVVYREALDDLLTQRALAVKAREAGLDKDPETLRRLQEATDHELARMLVRKVVAEMVTEDAVRKYYAASVKDSPGAEEVQMRVIATRTEDAANQALSRLRDGADFAEVARSVSIDTTALDGGEVGFTRRELLAREIGAVAFALAPGQMNAYPVLCDGAWFVVLVEARRQRPPPTLEEARNRILGELNRAASAEAFARVRASVNVTEYGPTGKPAPEPAPKR